MTDCSINQRPTRSDIASKKLMSIYDAVTEWYCYYCKNHSQKYIDMAYPQFRALEKILGESKQDESK